MSEQTVRKLYIISFIGCIFLLVVCSILYMGLIPIGYWMDEYILFSDLRDNGTSAVMLSRLLYWSPRPFSELLIFIYSQVVLFAKGQFIGLFLTCLWTIAGSLMIAFPAWLVRGRQVIILLAIGVLAVLSFLGQPVSQVFYWPMGAAPYLMTIAFITAFFWLCFTEGLQTKRDKIIATILLALAVMSHESGILFSIGLTGFCLIYNIFYEKRIRIDLFLIPPFLISIILFSILILGRVNSDIHFSSPVQQHALESFSGSFTPFFKEISKFLPRLIVCIGFYTLAQTAFVNVAPNIKDGISKWMLLLSLASFSAAYIVITLVIYQSNKWYGHSRYGNIFQYLMVISAVSFSCYVGIKKSYHIFRIHNFKKKICVTVPFFITICSLLVPSLPQLKYDYNHYNQFKEIAASNWSHVHDGNKDMTFFVLKPKGAASDGFHIDVGKFTRNSAHNNYMTTGLLLFFKKEQVTVQNPHP